MDAEDNGLLDRNRRQSQILKQRTATIVKKNQNEDLEEVSIDESSGMDSQNQNLVQPLTSEQEDQAAEDDEEQDQVRMIRYWRSKSLPYAYLPQIEGENSHHHHHRTHPNNTSIDSGSGCSSVFCSDICSNGGSGHHSHHSHSSRRTCTYNDPGCKPGTCNVIPTGVSRCGGVLGKDQCRDQRGNIQELKNGQVKNIANDSSGPPSGQVSKARKRSNTIYTKSDNLLTSLNCTSYQIHVSRNYLHNVAHMYFLQSNCAHHLIGFINRIMDFIGNMLLHK